MRISILQSQKEYLINHVLNGKDNLIQDIENGELANYKWEVNITNNSLDEIRDLCLEKLQEVGFDQNYKLTEQGMILEELIDIFYIFK